MRNTKSKRYALPIIAVVALIVCLLSGCSKAPEDVVLAEGENIHEYAKDTYGPCTVIETGEEVGSGEDRTVKCTLQDTEYKFLYDVESHVATVFIDGPLWYREGKASDFHEKYTSAFVSKYSGEIQEIEQKYACIVSVNTDQEASDFIIDIFANDKHEACSKEIEQLLSAFDTRGYFSEKKIACYLQETEEYIGSVHMADGGWRTEEQETIEFFMKIVKADLKDDTITYTKTEQRKTEEIIDVTTPMVSISEDTETEDATLYYFTYNDAEYWISDVRIRTEDNKDMFANNYQSALVEKEKEQSDTSILLSIIKILISSSKS